MHSRLSIAFVELRKFQDHLECVMAGVEIIRVPALRLSAETACIRLLWHSSLRQSVAFAMPCSFSTCPNPQILKFQMDSEIQPVKEFLSRLRM